MNKITELKILKQLHNINKDITIEINYSELIRIVYKNNIVDLVPHSTTLSYTPDVTKITKRIKLIDQRHNTEYYSRRLKDEQDN